MTAHDRDTWIEEHPPPLKPEDTAFLDHFTGEVIDTDDYDALGEALDRLKREEAQLYAYRAQLYQRILAKCPEGPGRMRRLRCDRLGMTMTVELPHDSWDKSKLKYAWAEYPEFREYLRLDSVAVALTHWKTAKGTAGNERFEQFKALIQSANRGPLGNPSIKLVPNQAKQEDPF